MPMSSAALAGIKANGHHWRGQLSLKGEPARLGDADSLTAGDCTDIRDRIVRLTREWLNSRPAREFDEDERADIHSVVDDLEMADDDPDELRHALNELYDKFDYYRICVVR